MAQVHVGPMIVEFICHACGQTFQAVVDVDPDDDKPDCPNCESTLTTPTGVCEDVEGQGEEIEVPDELWMGANDYEGSDTTSLSEGAIYGKLKPGTEHLGVELSSLVKWDMGIALAAGPTMLRLAKADKLAIQAAEKLAKKAMRDYVVQLKKRDDEEGAAVWEKLAKMSTMGLLKKRGKRLLKKLKAKITDLTPLEAAAVWLDFLEDVNAHSAMAAIEKGLTGLLRSKAA